MNTFEKIYKIVSNIPKGKVMTYGQVAKLAGVKNPRIVGYALHANKLPEQIPCHRVVYSDGKLSIGYAFGGINVQRKKLKDEGVTFINNSFVDVRS